MNTKTAQRFVGFDTDYDWDREHAYRVPDFFRHIDTLVERYFYGFHLAIGRRLIEGGFSREELRFLATQEYPYYASTTWWNAGKVLNADTLEQQRKLHGPLTEELGDDLVKPDGLPAHTELFVKYCEGLGLTRQDLERAPLCPGVVLAVTELRRISSTRPTHEFLATSNLVVERMRPRHYSKLLEAFQAHYTWVPRSALLFYEVHAHLDGDHESLGRRIVAQYASDRREQDIIFAAVLRSLSLRIAMYESIENAMARGGVGLVAWPNFPREPWPRPTPVKPTSV
jgi:pyrroloquinoline quinone (PQQ) biosynthesis protein C